MIVKLFKISIQGFSLRMGSGHLRHGNCASREDIAVPAAGNEGQNAT